MVKLMVILIACLTCNNKLLAIRNHRFLFCHQTLQMQAFVLSEFKNQILVISDSIRITCFMTFLNHLSYAENRTHSGNLPFLFHVFTQLFNQGATAVLSSKRRLLQFNHLAALNTFCLTALIHALSQLNLVLAYKQRHSADFLQIHTYRIINADAFRHRQISQLRFADLLIVTIVIMAYQRQDILIS